MALIIGTGSNLGDKKAHLALAKEKLGQYFTFTAESKIYISPPVGAKYEKGPYFYNQALEFQTPSSPPWKAETIMEKLLIIEKEMGRRRSVHHLHTPRVIDLDLLFLDEQRLETPHVTLPHPRLFERSFVVRPLSELPCFEALKKHFDFPEKFKVLATPL